MPNLIISIQNITVTVAAGSGSQQSIVQPAIGDFCVVLQLCYNIQGGELRFIKMVSVNQGIDLDGIPQIVASVILL